MDRPAPSFDLAALLARLGEALAPEQLITRGGRLARYGRDASSAAGHADVAVLARSAADVQHVLRVADELRVPVYPRGLGSGLSGGAVPYGGIALDLKGMNALLGVSPVNRSCTVQPGITAAQLNAQLAAHGLWYPPHPSSHEISTLGGNFAENAGGLTGVKYGQTRSWVMGATAVLPGGALLRCGSRASKDVAGFDLTGLLCGSEGLLAVVVELELRLLPRPAHQATAAFGFTDDISAARAAEALLAGPVTPRVLEFLDAEALRAIRLHTGEGAEALLAVGRRGEDLPRPGAGQVPAPTHARALLILEVDAFTAGDAEAQLAAASAALMSAGGTCLGRTFDAAAARAIWAVRSELSPACFKLGGYKLAEDVAVPRDRLADFIAGLKAIEAEAGLRFINYGHIGDGNFHCTLMFADERDPRLPAGHAAVEATYRLALDLSGTITGEHGIGALKAPYLALQLDATQLALLRRLKQAFDPHGILNPGKWL